MSKEFQFGIEVGGAIVGVAMILFGAIAAQDYAAHKARIEVQRQAMERGVGEFVRNNKGDIEFRWLVKVSR